MKKMILAIIIIIVLSVGSFFVWKKVISFKDDHKLSEDEEKIKNAKIEITLKDDLNIPFFSKAKVSDYIVSINGNIIDDHYIDTKETGTVKVEFEFINDEDIKVPYSYDVNVIDNVAPSIWIGDTYSVPVGYDGRIAEDIVCADDYDDDVKCELLGMYDTTTVGNYNLTYRATDKSGNVNNHDFILNVYVPSGGGGSSSRYKETPFADVVSWHKNENTKIGIDVSEWQNEIDFEAVKNAGVEFAIIRVGGTKGIDGEYFLDAEFVRNIEGFNSVGIPVGIYFYSYAKTKEAAINDANWLLEQIKGYQIDLPIAYDWENWSFFNEFHNSFGTLTKNALAFLDTVRDAGYEGMLYGSYNYLEKAWLDVDYTHWLAHYNETTDYPGEYTYWQICSNGTVAGIGGFVDIDVMYLNKKEE